MCLESQWNSMGVSSTKAPARGGGTSSGRRNSWPSLGVILFWYQSPSWSLANPLPLLSWVDQFLKTWPPAFATEMKEAVAEIKRLHQKRICLAQEAEDAEKERERMSNWVHDLMDQRHEIKAEIWRLEQDLNSKNEELAQLEARKKRVGSLWSEGSNSSIQCFRVVSGWCCSWDKGTHKEKEKQTKETPWPALTREAGVCKSYVWVL